MTTQTANSRINNYWEKFGLWACGVIIALLCLAYNDQKSRIEKMEERVQFLYIDKVNKSDLKDTEARLMNRIEGMQTDILARMDILFNKIDSSPRR